MITGNISDCEKYYPLNKSFEEVFEYLKADIYRMNFTVNISEPEISDVDKKGNKKVFEAHREYIDLHYIIDGCEDFGYANINTLKPITDYNEKDDYILLQGNENRITLYKGDFAIVFPEDAHIPAMKCDNGIKVKRAVVKIPVRKGEI